MDVISFGTVFVEFVFGAVPALPGPGDEVYADEFAISCGGAVSVASAARSVGASAGVATVLGEDLCARVVEAHCATTGVDLSPSCRVPGGQSGVTAVLNTRGSDRAFLSYAPADVRPGRSPRWWLDVVAEHRPRWVYLHAADGAMQVIEEARRAGCAVAVDTELGTVGRAPEIVRECAAAADLFVPNARELSLLTGTDDLDGAARALRVSGTMVVKAGADGAYVWDGGRLVPCTSGIQDVVVRDCTGAGDAFCGALLGSLVAGRPLAEAVEAGNIAGSAAVARLGAVGPVHVGWKEEASR